MTKEIIEGNKLIETFRGVKELTPDGKMFGIKRGMPKEYENYYDCIDADALCYHCDWDWLMPIVEKIEISKKQDIFNEYIGFTVKIARNYCSIMCHFKDRQDGVIYQTPYEYNPASKIEATWLAVVDFIKWYNK